MRLRRYGLIIFGVGSVWYYETATLAQCEMLPASCSPRLISQIQLNFLQLFVWYFGMFLSMPLTAVGILLLVWGFAKRRRIRLFSICVLLIAVAVAAVLPWFIWSIWRTMGNFGYYISLINIFSAPISAVIVFIGLYCLDVTEQGSEERVGSSSD
jgi:hypothetical protein